MYDVFLEVEMTKNIVFDWGGTIVKDALLFRHMADRYFYGPDSWEICKMAPPMSSAFFKESKQYPEAIRVVSRYCGTTIDSPTKNFIVFDNKPVLDLSQGLIGLSLKFQQIGGSANGIYIESDKLSLAKRISADIFVEDDPRIAITLANAGVKTILMLREWNKFFNYDILKSLTSKEKYEKIKDNFFFVEDWLDVENLIESLIKK